MTEKTYIVTIKDIRMGTIEVQAASEDKAKEEIFRRIEEDVLEHDIDIYDGDFEIVDVDEQVIFRVAQKEVENESS